MKIKCHPLYRGGPLLHILCTEEAEYYYLEEWKKQSSGHLQITTEEPPECIPELFILLYGAS
jgi:hypothetical protein